MKDDNDKIITRSQKKKLEEEKGEISFEFLKCTITRSILKYLYNDISKCGEDFKIESYLKKLGKELRTKEIELHVEYDTSDPKNLTENEQLYIGSLELTNEFFKNIIKNILKNKKKQGFSILKYLKRCIQEEDRQYQIISERLQIIHDKLKIDKKIKKTINMNSEEDGDVDERGNIKGLISYSDDELDLESNPTKKQIRDYGKYVHRLKGKKLKQFVKKEMEFLEDEAIINKSNRQKSKRHVRIEESEEEESEEDSLKKSSQTKLKKDDNHEYSSDEDSEFSDEEYDDEENYYDE